MHIRKIHPTNFRLHDAFCGHIMPICVWGTRSLNEKLMHWYGHVALNGVVVIVNLPMDSRVLKTRTFDIQKLNIVRNSGMIHQSEKLVYVYEK